MSLTCQFSPASHCYNHGNANRCKQKKRPINALGNFTRSTGTLRSLIQANPIPLAVVIPEAAKHWEKVMGHWDKLQSTHDDFLEKVDNIDIEKDKDGFPYLDAPTATYNEILLLYLKYCSDAKTREKQTWKGRDR